MTAFSTTEPFDRTRHRVDAFECGQPTLDRWLQQYAGQGQRRDTARTFVTARGDGVVVGYYTLLAGQVEREGATQAVNHDDQGRGLGAALLLDALERAVRASMEIAIRAVVVHAIDDDAAGFYRRFSFAPASSQPRTLMVPLEAVRVVLEARP